MSYSNKNLLAAWAELGRNKPIDDSYDFSCVVDLCGDHAWIIKSESPDGDLGHVAFVREEGVGFEILMCLITGREWKWTRDHDGPITKVWPTFYMRGRTFEGLLEVRSNDDLPSNIHALSEQLLWARKTIIKNGWDNE